jgi:hypothetical protein
MPIKRALATASLRDDGDIFTFARSLLVIPWSLAIFNYPWSPAPWPTRSPPATSVPGVIAQADKGCQYASAGLAAVAAECQVELLR